MGVYDINGNPLVSEGEDTYPDYLVSETNTVLSTVTNVCKAKSFLFTVITDSHNERNDANKKSWNDAIIAMRYIYKKYPSDYVIHLGDLIHGVLPTAQAKDRIRQSVADLRTISDKVFLCRGNHESNFAYDANHNELISTTELYSLTCRQNEPIVVRNNNKLYYYFDVKNVMRCIFLDSDMLGFTTEQTPDDLRNNSDGIRYGYDAEQIAWFRDVALDTNLQVIVFSHMPATRDYMTESPYWTDENRNSFDNIRAVAKAFVDNGGTIIGWFYGHVHNKAKHKNANAGFTEVGLRNSFGGSIPNFSLIAVESDARKVDIVSFGQDADDSFTY